MLTCGHHIANDKIFNSISDQKCSGTSGLNVANLISLRKVREIIDSKKFNSGVQNSVVMYRAFQKECSYYVE